MCVLAPLFRVVAALGRLLTGYPTASSRLEGQANPAAASDGKLNHILSRKPTMSGLSDRRRLRPLSQERKQASVRGLPSAASACVSPLRPKLGSAVCRGIGPGALPGNGRDVDDGATANPAHGREDGFRQDEWRAEVDVEHSIPGVNGEIGDRTRHVGCGGIHHHVNTTEPAGGRGNRVEDAIRI